LVLINEVIKPAYAKPHLGLKALRSIRVHDRFRFIDFGFGHLLNRIRRDRRTQIFCLYIRFASDSVQGKARGIWCIDIVLPPIQLRVIVSSPERLCGGLDFLLATPGVMESRRPALNVAGGAGE